MRLGHNRVTFEGNGPQHNNLCLKLLSKMSRSLNLSSILQRHEPNKRFYTHSHYFILTRISILIIYKKICRCHQNTIRWEKLPIKNSSLHKNIVIAYFHFARIANAGRVICLYRNFTGFWHFIARKRTHKWHNLNLLKVNCVTRCESKCAFSAINLSVLGYSA